MNTERLYHILQETTKVYRKGAEVEKRETENMNVTEIFGYPHTSEASQCNNFEKVDMVFVDVLVDKGRTEKIESELREILEQYPEPERLAGGPSYIELAPNLGLEQEGALRVMALGKTLGLWNIINGKTFKVDDKETRKLAGLGMLMISGYKVGNLK